MSKFLRFSSFFKLQNCFLTSAVTNIGTVSKTDNMVITRDIQTAAIELKCGRSGCIIQRYRSTAEKKIKKSERKCDFLLHINVEKLLIIDYYFQIFLLSLAIPVIPSSPPLLWSFWFWFTLFTIVKLNPIELSMRMFHWFTGSKYDLCFLLDCYPTMSTCKMG